MPPKVWTAGIVSRCGVRPIEFTWSAPFFHMSRALGIGSDRIRMNFVSPGMLALTVYFYSGKRNDASAQLRPIVFQ